MFCCIIFAPCEVSIKLKQFQSFEFLISGHLLPKIIGCMLLHFSLINSKSSPFKESPISVVTPLRYGTIRTIIQTKWHSVLSERKGVRWPPDCLHFTWEWSVWVAQVMNFSWTSDALIIITRLIFSNVIMIHSLHSLVMSATETPLINCRVRLKHMLILEVCHC